MDFPSQKTTGDLWIVDNKALFEKGRNHDEQEIIPLGCVPLVTATRCQNRGEKTSIFFRDPPPPLTEFTIHRDPIFTGTPLSQRLLLRRPHLFRETPFLTKNLFLRSSPLTETLFAKMNAVAFGGHPFMTYFYMVTVTWFPRPPTGFGNVKENQNDVMNLDIQFAFHLYKSGNESYSK